MKRLLYIVPALAFAVLVFVLFRGLNRRQPPNALPSMLIGKHVPAMTLAPLIAAKGGLSPANLRGHVTVLNFFGSWCVPCREEAPALAALARQTGFELDGLDYRDKPGNGRAFLNEMGDPYRRIGSDPSGNAGINWGIYGVPETFVIGRDGVVRARIVGPLDDPGAFAQLQQAIAAAQAS